MSVNHRVSAFLESYFDIIFALNELTHPGEKRMISYAKEQANILPKDFETNILKLCSINSQNREIAVEDCLNDIISNLREVIDKNIR